MTKEPYLIIKRRFTSRILESGLLIIAVALGVGAASSGLSLLFHTNEYSKSLLSSPEYREVVVTTKSNIDDMVLPAMEKGDDVKVSLSTVDLKAGELIPTISFSYITNNDRLRFITESDINRRSNQESNGSEGGQPKENNDDPKDQDENQKQREEEFTQNLENFTQAKENPNYIIPEVEELNGREVSSEFFSAWNLDTVAGSLFTDKDYTANNKYIILGSEVAKLLASDEYEVTELVNKKIITWDASYTVIGILEPTLTSNDNYYFTPIKELTTSSRFRRGGDDQQLRFSVLDPSDLDGTAQMLQDWFDTKYDEGQVVVSNPRAEATRVVNRNRGISILILFLSLAGLFIASVNVSNILMSRSLRMKRHVGILKALGASKKSIVNLFTSEAIVITIVGSILGTGLAIPLSIAMQKSLDLGEVSWVYILIGVFLSSLLTLLFSVIPARQNTNIEAAVAMRSAG